MLVTIVTKKEMMSMLVMMIAMILLVTQYKTGSFLASAKEAEPEVKGDLLSHNTDLLLAHNKVRWSSPTLCLSSSSSLSTTFTFSSQAAERGQSKQVDEAAHHTIAIIQVDQSSPSIEYQD